MRSYRLVFAAVLIASGFLLYYLLLFESHIPTALLRQQIPGDHPYLPLFLRDDHPNQKLGAWVRGFLERTRNWSFPTRHNEVFLDTLLEFDRFWRKELGRKYMIFAGTLLGAYRHGGKIPFDDDLDIVVDMIYERNFSQDFNKSRLECTHGGPFRKVWFTDNRTLTNKFGRWPFIDVFFYELKNNGKDLAIRAEKTYPARYALPQIEMPFMGHWILAPRCPQQFVTHGMDRKSLFSVSIIDMCCSSGYNHRLDIHSKSHCIRCWRLQEVFQFAKWRRINKTHAQQLLSVPPGPRDFTRTPTWKKGPVLRMPQC